MGLESHSISLESNTKARNLTAYDWNVIGQQIFTLHLRDKLCFDILL